jgi:hypothetical protein
MLPARDLYHGNVRNALTKDGWRIVNDPLWLRWRSTNLYADLRAERDGESIAVEIKSFVGRSDVADLEQAIGQFLVYRAVLSRRYPDIVLWMAVSTHAYKEIFRSGLGRLIRIEYQVKVVIIDLNNEEIVAWHP